MAAVLHLDLDAFFASVEQRDKPSLRGKPVIVGGIGTRGVVATASYQARAYGVHSVMPTHKARRLCPHAAFLYPRFSAYREASDLVMGLLRELSPVVEPLSLDEAFVDLAAGSVTDFSAAALLRLAADLRSRLTEVTEGLTASVGLGSSKFMAKVATELGKPNGVFLVEPGTEVTTIAPLSVRKIPGVGPVTADKLARLGVVTVQDLQGLSRKELVRELGSAAGDSLWSLAFANDDRPVVAEPEVKSISYEDTFSRDLTRPELAEQLIRDCRLVAQKLVEAKLFARTISIKVRTPDFTTFTRSRTLIGATDRVEVIRQVAEALLDSLDVSEGVRLFGVGVSGFTTVAQEALFEVAAGTGATVDEYHAEGAPTRRERGYYPGVDIWHEDFGPGWVWGSGLGLVTVRFETKDSGPGPVKTFSLTDERLRLA